MSVIDLLITIIVVTILVTIALGVATYIAYKLRLARQPALAQNEEPRGRYFVLHEPPSEAPVPPQRVDAT
jgi:Tfp pilus assembly protein PilE